MKKQILLSLVLLVSVISSNGQVMNRLLPSQVPAKDTLPPSLLWVDTVIGSMHRVWAMEMGYFFGHIHDSSTKWGDTRWLKLSDTPTLSIVGRTGDYTDLLNQPSLFSGSYNDLTNTPSLFSGNYNDLSNKPNLFDGDYDNLSNKPELFSGSYTDLTDKPTIPTQVSITGAQNTKVTGTYPNVVIADSFSTSYYNTAGIIKQNVKVFVAEVTPNTSNGYSIDISAAGFSTILSTSVIAKRNTSTASTSPNVSIKSESTSAIVVNVTEDNPNTIAILGISVLSGLPSVFANVTGLTLKVIVIGY